MVNSDVRTLHPDNDNFLFRLQGQRHRRGIRHVARHLGRALRGAPTWVDFAGAAVALHRAAGIPATILSPALLLFYRTIKLWGPAALVLAHTLIGMPYRFHLVLACLQSFNLPLEEGAQSPGAEPIRTFFLVTLPLIWPGVPSNGLFAFIVSFGELNVALFLTGSDWVGHGLKMPTIVN